MMVTSDRAGTWTKVKPRAGWKLIWENKRALTLSHSWSRLANGKTTRRAASGVFVLSAGTARDGSLWLVAELPHRRQSFALRARHHSECGYRWRAAVRCQALPKLACTTNR